MKPLSYEIVDDLAFAASLGRLGDFVDSFEVVDLGPFVELAYLSRSIPTLRAVAQACFKRAALPPVASAAASSRLWVSDDRLTGTFRSMLGDQDEEIKWTKFGLSAQQAARQAGFKGRVPAQLVGAMSELYENIYEHAGTPRPGVVGFRAGLNSFEFVVSDAGRGILNSLRSAPQYAQLQDDADALRLALTEGVSRFNDPARGRGFRPLFVGLAELKGKLRFRSGAAALLINGKPELMTASLSQKVVYPGFHASVSCSPTN
ncbi:ATP-binding protein [Sphingomonas sp. OK281]|uniref:ATP-binding protein n=1 Tax=Sphingomonas sp. OK281 TaxID=1881067 RepID=UPI00111341D5|nr:ATP-binding protein [Sphingomonas sp. OK281]